MQKFNEEFVQQVFNQAGAALEAYYAIKAKYPAKVAGTVIEATALEVEVLGNLFSERIQQLHEIMRPTIDAIDKKKK